MADATRLSGLGMPAQLASELVSQFTTSDITGNVTGNLTGNITGLDATYTELNRAADVSTRLVAAGGTLSATVADHEGRIILLDTAAGSVVTLPAATGSGAVFSFLVSTTATSNSHVIETASTSDHMTGFIALLDLDGTALAAYKADGTADDTITMNRTTTGGVLGDYVEVVDIAANLWLVRNACLTTVAGSNVADPFSAAVS